ncbi:WYL domain-containing protein [Brevibacterium sp. R8603A2]|uniref:helix-turn-helix transcriptional regulator n=1 Tax=Brevibacterium sp. R8603A2 TaxID=2929779 RepID=UPI001FF74F4B|nr:WYL domain-containing protein [Brevibacterium sp. R8603A2]MCK1804059.1 WYL domain-containing protein [Brevibacterium sp. R8603A2]
MRSTRLLSLIMDLSRLRTTSVGVLAERHGVSERTVQRDLAELQAMGVPVWTRTGPAGGVGIVEGWSSPITGMPQQEITALLLGEAAARELGLAGEHRAARLRLRGEFGAPEADGHDADGIEQRVLVDAAAWFTETEEPPALAAVSRAVWTGRRLRIRYRRGTAAVSRLVDPLGLVLKTDRWYLVAAHRRALRTYRVSRIAAARVVEAPARRPAGFSLAEHWAQARTAFERGLTGITVRVAVDRSALPALRHAVPGAGASAAVDAAEPDAAEHGAVHGDTGAPAARIVVELPMETEAIAVSQLLQVPAVEVLSPAPVREEVARRGRALWEANTRGAVPDGEPDARRAGSPGARPGGRREPGTP